MLVLYLVWIHDNSHSFLSKLEKQQYLPLINFNRPASVSNLKPSLLKSKSKAVVSASRIMTRNMNGIRGAQLSKAGMKLEQNSVSLLHTN